MGIYGESMTLVTEGKISDLFKKAYNKIAKKLSDQYMRKMEIEARKRGINLYPDYSEYDKHNKELEKQYNEYINSIEYKADVLSIKEKSHGHYKFYMEYIEPRFLNSTITAESAENYINDIKSVFGSININEIKKLYKKYDRKEFLYSEDDYSEARDDRKFLKYAYENIISKNISVFNDYENENYTKNGKKVNKKDNFFVAINLQIDLLDFATTLINEMFDESMRNYDVVLKRLKEEQE